MASEDHVLQKVDYQRFFWPHSMADYKKMFNLSGTDLKMRILEYAGGPSSFNVEMCASGREHVTSCDPLYQTEAPDIVAAVKSGTQRLYDHLNTHFDRYRPEADQSADDYIQTYQNNVEQFVGDYASGIEAKRYCAVNNLRLDYPDHHFQLALCPHYLFTGVLGDALETYVSTVTELCRVAHELRVYPLLDKEGEISPILGPLMLALQAGEYKVSVEDVPFHFQKNGNAMMRIQAGSCQVLD